MENGGTDGAEGELVDTLKLVWRKESYIILDIERNMYIIINCGESRLERRSGGAWDICEKPEKLHIAAGLVTKASTGIGNVISWPSDAACNPCSRNAE